jgi:CO/xanthine dehydrogenase Mo-binding subunit
MTEDAKGNGFRFIGKPRRAVEHRRFVAGKGRYAADIDLPGMLHLALVASPYPAARIVEIKTRRAAAMPGVVEIITGAGIADETAPLISPLDTPEVKRWPLAHGQVRYAGEWVAAVVGESRALAEDAAEEIEVDYAPLEYVIDPEQAYLETSPPVYEAHGSNIVLERKFSWGPVDRHFADADHRLKYRCRWHRSATVPIETFVVAANWDPWTETLDVWASIQMPKFVDQMARSLKLGASRIRAHLDVDVGGSYGVKRGLKHCILAAAASRRTGRPVRLVEDRLENMTGGDAHGPDRLFDVELAYDDDGIVKSLRMRALDNVGAYPGRASFQLGKPVGAIVGPYTIESAAYHPISVTTNITPQEAVRGFGQAPTNFAIERGMDLVARALDMDRLELRRRNLIPKDRFPYLIPSGTTYDSGEYHTMLDKLMAAAGGWDEQLKTRDRLRETGLLAGLGLATCLEPSGGNSSFEPLLNPKNDTTTWMETCQVTVDAMGGVTAILSTNSSGQGHETLVSASIGEVLGIEPDRIRVTRATSQTAGPSNSPVGSRMAIVLGGAASAAAREIRDKLIMIGAREFGAKPEELEWADAGVTHKVRQYRLDWDELVHICHRNAHRLVPGQQPGLGAVHTLQVPTGGALPDEHGRVHMYPCTTFEAHLVLIKMDPIICRPEIVSYHFGHDCGTVITPEIVRGMSLGGIAHGLGAALMERFEFDQSGQPITATFLDYPMPSAHEMPDVEIIRHTTPSPHTSFGQKGAGESGYLGAPAALANAVNDALAPGGNTINELPMRMAEISDLVHGRA